MFFFSKKQQDLAANSVQAEVTACQATSREIKMEDFIMISGAVQIDPPAMNHL